MYQKYPSQSGNILFLILIAVALFAALSYAVTSSTRSGSGDVSSEKLQLQYARIQSYVTALRGAVTRMKMNGIAVEDINFNPPAQFGILTTEQKNANIFYPAGGNVPFQVFDFIPLAGSSDSVFLFALQIESIGTTVADDSGNDITLAVAVTDQMCNFVNKKIGYTGAIPVIGSFVDDGKFTYSLSSNGGLHAGIVSFYSLPAWFTGKSEGCANDPADGNNFYYTTIVER